MSVKDHIMNFVLSGTVGGVAVFPIAATAEVSAHGVGTNGPLVLAGVIGALTTVFTAYAAAFRVGEFKPVSAITGGLTGLAATAFAICHFHGPAPEFPAAPSVNAPVTTLITEGTCKKNMRTQISSNNGPDVVVLQASSNPKLQ